jgi:hypothetical protein
LIDDDASIKTTSAGQEVESQAAHHRGRRNNRDAPEAGKMRANNPKVAT